MAKGIEKVAKRFAVETCVYWGSPVSDRMGGFTFAPPVELPCRWDEKTEVKLMFSGQQYTSAAGVLLVDDDVVVGGYLFRGTLEDLPENYVTIEDEIPVAYLTPMEIKGAYVIQEFFRIPMVRKNDEFIRTAYLYDHG